MGGAGLNLGSDLSGFANSALASRKENIAMEAQELNLAALKRREDLEMAKHNQQMFINNNHDAIANDLSNIDAEAEDYDDRIAHLPSGIDQSPLFKGKWESLNTQRNNVLKGRAESYKAAVAKEAKNLADWEEEYLPHLSFEDQQDFRNNKMFNPNFNSRTAHINYGQSAVMGKSSFDMLETIKDQAKTRNADFAIEEKGYAEVFAEEKRLLGIIASTEKAYKDQGDQLYTEQTLSQKNARNALAKLKVPLEKARIGSASLRGRQIEAGRASKIKAYNHHVKLKLGREGIGFINKMAEIEGDKDIDADTRNKAKKAVAHQAQPLYSFAYKELAATHEYIFNPVDNGIPESFRFREANRDGDDLDENPSGVVVQPELTREVILAFNAHPEKQVHFEGNKMYVNPFNAPSEDDLPKVVLKAGYAEKIRSGKTGKDFQGVLNKFWTTKEEKQKATRWILSTIAGEEISQDDLNSLGGAQKAFLQRLKDSSKNLENSPKGFDFVTAILQDAAR